MPNPLAICLSDIAVSLLSFELLPYRLGQPLPQGPPRRHRCAASLTVGFAVEPDADVGLDRFVDTIVVTRQDLEATAKQPPSKPTDMLALVLTPGG